MDSKSSDANLSQDLTSSSTPVPSEMKPSTAREMPSTTAPEMLMMTEEQATVISARDRAERNGGSTIRPINSAWLRNDLVGQTLGHFELREFIGAGGMGAVFRGFDTLLGREVAIKVLSRENNGSEETVRRFRNEAQSAARLDHPNIARVYFVGTDNDWNYIVFEYIEGHNIRDLVDRDGPLPVEQALDYALQIAEALHHASQRDIVHRDIKPSNILINSAGTAKLVDMGLARLHQVDDEDGDLTASGVTLGTFDYISPEQARDPRLADVRSDLYSLGCTLYYMLTGRPPFPEGTVLQKLLSHSSDEPLDPRELRDDLPDEIMVLLGGLTAKNPQDRYQTPAEFIAEMLLFCEDLGMRLQHGGGMTIAADVQPPTIVERHFPWVAPILAFVAIFFVMDAVWSARSSNNLLPPLSFQDQSGYRTASSPNGAAAVAPLRNDREIAAIPDRPDPMSPSPSPMTSPPPSEANPLEDPLSPLPMIMPPAAVDMPNVKVVSVASAAQIYDAVTKAKLDPRIDTIELRFNGPVKIDSPLLLEGDAETEKITMRAAIGFAPELTLSIHAMSMYRNMIRVGRVQALFEGLAFRLETTDASVDPGCLFLLETGGSIKTTRCTFTVAAPANMAVLPAVFRRPLAIAMTPATSTEVMMYRPPSITLVDTTIRGETDVVHIDQASQLKFDWQNGLLAISGVLLDSQGSTKASTDLIDVRLNRVTAAAAKGLFRLESSTEFPEQRDVEATLTDCIVRWSPSEAMVLQYDRAPSAKLTDLNSVRFKGDNNFYDLTSSLRQIFWEKKTRLEIEALNAEKWGAAVEGDKFAKRDPITWAKSLESLPPYSQRLLSDYRLDAEAEGNYAYDKKVGGEIAGADFAKLPKFPADAAAASSAGTSTSELP
ncbi:serine/threonine protein kinase [Blastopirellula sp. JC732]|uniref:Serine/threonine protein kinase n=1 Tax=Blastopirellula sediminis TaxID=2894196 RepID=A0A9X1SES5_9BACT|nr:serine/threonine-protein kinase [Blastopirellula sediminis]MCC9608998.1 serine/threonine protein kinase [Blastopirellula sediminis]MCC9628225.1 serine/threonine protein kinase [Blastopirellula sediminis]